MAILEAINPTLPHDQDDRLAAALSHGSILLPFIGSVVPVILWLVKRGKSPWVAFQSLQALLYHMLVSLVWLVCLMVNCGGLMLVFIAQSKNEAYWTDMMSGILLYAPFLFLLVTLLLEGLLILFALGAAYICIQGKNFRYPVLANWIETNFHLK